MAASHIAIYARVSTDDQSVDAQLHDLRHYCTARGWEDPEVFTDHGISGAKSSRPGWNACWDATRQSPANNSKSSKK